MNKSNTLITTGYSKSFISKFQFTIHPDETIVQPTFHYKGAQDACIRCVKFIKPLD
jgi:hypothetical protein